MTLKEKAGLINRCLIYFCIAALVICVGAMNGAVVVMWHTHVAAGFTAGAFICMIWSAVIDMKICRGKGDDAEEYY